MDAWAKLIQAVAGLVGAVAWPIALVLLVWILSRRHKEAIDEFVRRLKAANVLGVEVSLAEAAATKEAQVEELQEQALSPEISEAERQEVVQALRDEAEQLGRIRTVSGYFHLLCPVCGRLVATRVRPGAACPFCGAAFGREYLISQAQRVAPRTGNASAD